MRVILISLVLMLVTACASEPVVKTEYIEIEKPVYHPTLPVPPKTYNPSWVVINVEGDPYVGMKYDSSVKYRIWLEELKSYIQNQNVVICSYRSDC